MAASKQLGIKEVLNLEIANFSTGNKLLYADYATNTIFEATAERLDLRGGQGNYKLMSFDHTKNMTFKTELPLVDLDFISYLSGKPMTIGAVTVPKREVLVTTGATPTITLSETPVSGLKVFLLSGDRDNGTEQVAGTPSSTENKYSIVSKTITLNATTAPAGTSIVVSYDYTTTSVLNRTITFTADKFATYVSINGYGTVSDQVDGLDYPTIFKIYKAKPKNNWTLTMSPTEATKLNVEFDVYPVNQSDGSGGTDKVYMKMFELV